MPVPWCRCKIKTFRRDVFAHSRNFERDGCLRAENVQDSSLGHLPEPHKKELQVPRPQHTVSVTAMKEGHRLGVRRVLVFLVWSWVCLECSNWPGGSSWLGGRWAWRAQWAGGLGGLGVGLAGPVDLVGPWSTNVASRGTSESSRLGASHQLTSLLW